MLRAFHCPGLCVVRVCTYNRRLVMILSTKEGKSVTGGSGKPTRLGLILVLGLLVCAGCGPREANVAVRLQRKASVDRIREIRRIDASGDASSVSLLVQRLDDGDSAVRFAAIITLERITGERLGYRYGASSVDRGEAVGRWRAYVEDRAAGQRALTIPGELSGSQGVVTQ